MRKLDTDLGRIYHKDDFYYLEKVFDNLEDLVEDENSIKQRAKNHGFRIIKSSWKLEKNPYYYVETIINGSNDAYIDKLRYVFKMKLKYIK